MKRNRLQGFTLIELLVVIAIIGLLATMSVVSFSTSRDKARISKGAGFEGQILRSIGDDIVGRWDFDECNGTIYDSSGYGNNFTLSAGVTFSANTPLGQGCSIALNGTTGQISIPNSSLGMQQTKTMWVYIVGAVSGNQYLIDEGINNNTIQIYTSHILMSENLPVNGYILSNTPVVNSRWYFIAVAYDGTSMNLYIDGALDKSQAMVGVAPTGPIMIGNYGGGGGYHLNGNLDDVRLFNRSLTSQEIHQMYAEGQSSHLAMKR